MRSRLDALPRFAAARLPTPLDYLPRISDRLGVSLFCKREDLTGLAFGGNKSRELDFFIGEALARGATVFIAGGGVAQSNHAVQCAAAARRAGLLPVMVLHRFRAEEMQGNLLLSNLLGTDLRLIDNHEVDAAIDARTVLEREMQRVAEEYRACGHNPFVLPSSFNVLGAVGYVDGAAELFEQMGQLDRPVDYIYVTSAGATQVGLALGLKALGCTARVRGISYTASSNALIGRMLGLAAEAARRLDLPISLEATDIENQSYAGPGYGIPTEAGIEAIQLLATTEGMFLDPVYSGKGMSGLIDHVRRGLVREGSSVVFVHTGGLPGIFAYSRELMDQRPNGTTEAGEKQ